MSVEVSKELAEIRSRLDVFEGQHAIRVCINRYMELCDTLNADTPIDELSELFTVDAIWEGKGVKYASSFGGYRGRQSIREMFERYMKPPVHFALNVHFLTSEVVDIHPGGQGGQGRWVMLQTSTFADGASHLNAAKLTVEFARENDTWRMSHFQTENLFGRPTQSWNSEVALPVPNR